MAALSSKSAKKAQGEKPSSALAIVSIAACFVLWASLFVYRSSVVAIDGRRYFALFDDAMISMRYAWNLSHGFGLVWNPGEYVEGYTNPLWTLVMSLPTSLFDKSGAVLAIQVLGVVLMLANAYLVMLIADHLFSGEIGRHAGLFRVLAFLCGLSYYPLVYWTLMGMETGLLAILLSLSVLSALRYVRDYEPARGLLLSACLGLAFLTRPDAVVFAVPIFAYVFFGGRRAITSSHLLTLVGPFALIVAGQEAFRWVYYGELVPNTYTLKVTGWPLIERIENGMGFVRPFLAEVWVLLVLVGTALLFDFRKGKLLLAGVFVVALLYQVWTGGDAWDRWRIFSPAMPLMLVLAVREIFRVVAAVSDTAGFRGFFERNPVVPRRHVPGLVSVLAVLAVLCVVNFRFLPEITMQQDPEDEELNEERMSLALALERFTEPDATVGVFAAGTVPYYSGRPAIDFLGKMDPRIARLAPDLKDYWSPGEVLQPSRTTPKIVRPGHSKYDLEYSIKQLKPTYVKGFDWHNQSVLDWAKNEYVRVKYEGDPKEVRWEEDKSVPWEEDKSVYLNLLRDSEEVRWDEVRAAVEAGEAHLETPK
jgi:arabinofuranosyltransferase